MVCVLGDNGGEISRRIDSRRVCRRATGIHGAPDRVNNEHTRNNTNVIEERAQLEFLEEETKGEEGG